MTHYSASLYVGDLHPQVNEQFLYEVFSESGPILSIKVCRDTMTMNSLGYAYVNFQDPKDAERAIDTLNYTQIKGKPIRIMWCQRDPSVRKGGDGNIFIKNLDKSVDNKSLYDTFSIFGNILSCKVSTSAPRDKDSKPVSLGYGFVHFETKKAAQDAIKTVNGMMIQGKKVFVGEFKSRSERKSDTKPIKFTNVFIKNLSKDVTKKDLLSQFEKYGEITSSELKEDKKLGKQFGFINYKNNEDAVKSLEFNGKKLGGKGDDLYVSRAQVKSERELHLQKEYEKRRAENLKKFQGVNLYVKNIDETFDDEKFKEVFSKYGKVTSSKIMKDDKKKSKGFGFVSFENSDEANKALTELHGKMVGSKPLYVSLAQRRDVRKQMLEQQFQQQQQLRGIQMIPQQGQNIFPQQQQQQLGEGGQFYNNKPFQGKPRINNGQRNNQQFNNNGQRVGGKRGGKNQQQGNSSGGKRGYKYNQNARNRPDEQQQQQQQKSKVNQQQQQLQNQPQDVLNPSFLAQHSSQQQKRFLGDRIYPLVHLSQPEYANKITGMLLEMETGDILHLLENPDALNAKIAEALIVLKDSEKKTKK